RAADEARASHAVVLPRQVRRGPLAPIRAAVVVAEIRRVPGAGDSGPYRAVARRPAPRRRAVAALLPAAPREHPLHLRGGRLEVGGREVPGSTFSYRRRVQFFETDAAGIVHFSSYFRYFEEAEHALWREAGMTIHPEDSSIGWPRISASCEFRKALKFEQ